mgnify:CR=1 FL=1
MRKDKRNNLGIILLLALVFFCHLWATTKEAIKEEARPESGPSLQERKKYYEEVIKGRAGLKLHEAQYYKREGEAKR